MRNIPVLSSDARSASGLIIQPRAVDKVRVRPCPAPAPARSSSRTNAASLPAICSASAHAQSFADETTTDLSISVQRQLLVFLQIDLTSALCRRGSRGLSPYRPNRFCRLQAPPSPAAASSPSSRLPDAGFSSALSSIQVPRPSFFPSAHSSTARQAPAPPPFTVCAISPSVISCQQHKALQHPLVS